MSLIVRVTFTGNTLRGCENCWQRFWFCLDRVDRYDFFITSKSKIYGCVCRFICFITITSSVPCRENSGGCAVGVTWNTRRGNVWKIAKSDNTSKGRDIWNEVFEKKEINGGEKHIKSGRVDGMAVREAEMRGKLCHE